MKPCPTRGRAPSVSGDGIGISVSSVSVKR